MCLVYKLWRRDRRRVEYRSTSCDQYGCATQGRTTFASLPKGPLAHTALLSQTSLSSKQSMTRWPIGVVGPSVARSPMGTFGSGGGCRVANSAMSFPKPGKAATWVAARARIMKGCIVRLVFNQRMQQKATKEMTAECKKNASWDVRWQYTLDALR